MKGRTDVRANVVRTDVHDVMAIKPKFLTSMQMVRRQYCNSLIHCKVHGVILHMSILGKIDRQKEVSACIPDFSLASQTGYLAGGRFNR